MKANSQIKQDLLDKIAELTAKVNELDNAKAGVIYDEPKYGTTVWFLDVGVVIQIGYSSSSKPRLDQGVLFYDKESAMLESKRREIKYRLGKFCRDNNFSLHNVKRLWFTSGDATIAIRHSFNQEELDLALGVSDE